jgi:hypothetical protein
MEKFITTKKCSKLKVQLKVAALKLCITANDLAILKMV